MIGQTQMASRLANVAPWEPLLGMEKRQCPECRYLFAAPVDVEEQRCPDCAIAGSGPGWRPGGRRLQGTPRR
jgi:hypothetical protein